MKIIGQLSRILGGQNTQLRAEEVLENLSTLTPVEVRLLTATNELESLRLFALSARINAVDPKGDTPLHLAARVGNLALCDLLVASGADANAHNNENLTPADVAKIEGHFLAAQLLSMLIHNVGEPTNEIGTPEPQKGSYSSSPPKIEVLQNTLDEPSLGHSDHSEDIEQYLHFLPDENPEIYRPTSNPSNNSGLFRPVTPSFANAATPEEADWEVDLTPAQISGDAIGISIAPAEKHGNEQDFLKQSGRGKQSTRRATVNKNTTLSMEPDFCSDWVSWVFRCDNNTILQSSCDTDDIRFLITHCKGNVDADDLIANIQRTIEAAGLELLPTFAFGDRVYSDVKSIVEFEDLVEAIEAVLTRHTRLPGTQLFDVSKGDEVSLLEPMIRTKQDLLLNLLASPSALGSIIYSTEQMNKGLRDPRTVTLRTLFPARVEHQETNEFFDNVDTLRQWSATGRVMDGKHRREALHALDALDLTLPLMREIADALKSSPSTAQEGAIVDNLVTWNEAATQKLIISHLPYVRRFSSRIAEAHEDPEDVFQIAFMGLQLSTRRFDPERGVRFVIYSTFWMRQAVTRWRADEGGQIRVPAHRFDKLVKLDAAIDKLDIRSDRGAYDAELADAVNISSDEALQLRSIPRIPVNLEYDDWDRLVPPQELECSIELLETQNIVSDALEQLNDRDADVIRMRFGIGQDNEMTLEEIGQIYGVSRQRIQQIEAKAMGQLSHPARKSRMKMLLGI